jgi:hypothetical protein
MASDTLELIQGDADITLSGVVFDAATKKPMILTGYALVLFFWSYDDGALKQTLYPTVTDELKGEYDVIVPGTCMAIPGSFEFEMQLTKGTTVQTIPRRQRVTVKSQRG